MLSYTLIGKDAKVNGTPAYSFGDGSTSWNSPEVGHVELFGNDDPFQLPTMSSSVKSLVLENLDLIGPVALPVDLESLEIGVIRSEVPIWKWTLPSSLRQISVQIPFEKACDFSQTQLEEIEVCGHYNGPKNVLNLPQTLRRLVLSSWMGTRLPRLPIGLVSLKLELSGCLEDYSGAEMVKELSIDRIFPFEEYFPNLEHLTLTGLRDQETFSTATELRISVPGLKTLTVAPAAVIRNRGKEHLDVFTIGLDKTRIVLDWIPSLESLELSGLNVWTNNVWVRDYEQYVKAWGGISVDRSS